MVYKKKNSNNFIAILNIGHAINNSQRFKFFDLEAEKEVDELTIDFKYEFIFCLSQLQSEPFFPSINTKIKRKSPSGKKDINNE